MKSNFYLIDLTNTLYQCFVKSKTNLIKYKQITNYCEEGANTSQSQAAAGDWTNEEANLSLNRKIIQINPLELMYLLNLLHKSTIYRNKFIQFIRKSWSSKENLAIALRIVPATKEPIDYKWNEITIHSAYQQMELDHLMSWLSTLGGAFSALGDSFDHCADIAGKISIYQLTLAARFGDPLIVSRSKLYISLSYIQKGRLREAKHIIREQYKFAKSVYEIDSRLSNMCLGIWMKLQYTYSLRHLKKTNPKPCKAPVEKNKYYTVAAASVK